MGAFQSSLLGVGSTHQCRTLHHIRSRIAENDRQIAAREQILRRLRERREEQGAQIRTYFEQLGAQFERERREERVARTLVTVEESWRGIVEFQQWMLLSPGLGQEWNKEIGSIVANAFEHMRGASEDESHMFHEVACRVLGDYDAWVVDHEEEIR